MRRIDGLEQAEERQEVDENQCGWERAFMVASDVYTQRTWEELHI